MRWMIAAAPLLLLAPAAAPAQTTAADHTFARSGSSRSVAPWAQPSQRPGRMLGFVGGGAVRGGEGPAGALDGVMGYDFVGHRSPDRIFLGWLHTHTAPPGGPYRTDGRRVFDVFSIRPLRKALADPEE